MSTSRFEASQDSREYESQGPSTNDELQVATPTPEIVSFNVTVRVETNDGRAFTFSEREDGGIDSIVSALLLRSLVEN